MSVRDRCMGHWEHRQFIQININTVLSYTLELDQGILRQNIAESAKDGLLTRPPRTKPHAGPANIGNFLKAFAPLQGHRFLKASATHFCSRLAWSFYSSLASLLYE